MKSYHTPLGFTFLSVILSLGCISSHAEDIDLFNVTPSGSSPKPNVLFVLDNSANWDATLFSDASGSAVTKKEAIHAALYRLAADNGWADKIRMGIMTLANSNNPKGGRLLHAIGDLNTSAYSPDYSKYRYNRYRLLDKIWGNGITTSYQDPNNASKTITDSGPPVYQWWCNTWIDGTTVDWNKYNSASEIALGDDSDWVIKRDVNGDGVNEVGDDCYIPSPFTVAYNTGYGNVITDSSTNQVYIDGYPGTSSAIWDYDTYKQIHYHLDPVDLDLVTSSSDPAYATYPYTYVSDPDLLFHSQSTGEITVTKLSKITVVGSGPRIPKTNNRPFALTLYEAYLYLNGDKIVSGLGDEWYDETTNKGADNWVWYDSKLGTYTSAFSSATQYKSPVNDANSCARSFIIFIGNGHPDASEDGDAENYLRALNGVLDSDPIPLIPDNDESNWSDEFARFLYAKDFTDTQTETQNATTFVIDVFDPDEIQNDVDRAERSFLQSIANQGHGNYYAAKSTDAIYDAMEDALTNILATNSVFASTTLPVSVNVRGTNLNQVYMGVFRPDADWNPRWMGNLKLYQLALDTNRTLYLADAYGKKAENTVSGFIVDDAMSYWTFDETSDYWNFDALNYPNPSDAPDGKQVEKGAAAQRIRKDVIAHMATPEATYDTSRPLYTCADNTCSNNNVVAFNEGTAGSRLAITSPDYTSKVLVDWVYGKRKSTDSTSEESPHSVRASVHGDVLHSRPAVIAYNDADENDVIAYYGANDGIFRAVKGGKTSSGSNLEDGHEIWGLIFPDFLPKLKKLYDNVSINNDPTDTIPDNPKPYFADGSIGILKKPATGQPTNVYLYVSMRRGGRFIYALNVSPPTAGTLPTNFSIMWKKSSDDFPELGQTWSEPKVAKLKVGATTYKDVVIFGGGYNPEFDDVVLSNRDTAVASYGSDIFVLDAMTGDLIWQASKHTGNTKNNFVAQYPIPSDVSAIDLDGDGDVDRLYVGDTGGNLWRVNIGDTTTVDDWAVDKLASVGSNKKFLYPPDVVEMESGQLAILIGSGDREDPRNKHLPTGHLDRFYMFEDTAGSTTDLDETLLADIVAGEDVATKDGCFVELRPGEKVVTSAVTLNGWTFFNTSQVQPAGAIEGTSTISCSGTLGTARACYMKYDTCQVKDCMELAGGGLPPSPVAVIVEPPKDPKCETNPELCESYPPTCETNPDLCDDPPPPPSDDPNGCDSSDGRIEAIVTGTTVITPEGSTLDVRQRNYWFEEID